MIATLAEVLRPARAGGYAVAGLVCLGWEDARAYVAAAEALGAPVILQAGPGARAHMPVRVWGAMFRSLAEAASVPVVAHLDHGEGFEACMAGIEAGFTSVMFDGSRLPLAENIAQTARIAEAAHRRGVSVEAELGFVGYAAGEASRGTDPAEAARFGTETGVDALAISVGNVHLMQSAVAAVDWARLAAIEAACAVPLVIHGGSGLSASDRQRMSAGEVGKINIGTELRQAFGAALRGVLRDPGLYDRIAILRGTEAAVEAAALAAILSCGWKGV